MDLNYRCNLCFEFHLKPKVVAFATYQSRLESFGSWPESKGITQEQLAEAGFFDCGNNDFAMCHYCAGICHRWEPNDDPWVRHAQSYPKCGFLLLKKGQSFVEECRGNNDEQFTSSDEDSEDEDSQQFNNQVIIEVQDEENQIMKYDVSNEVVER